MFSKLQGTKSNLLFKVKMIRGIPFDPITVSWIFFEGIRNADTGEMQSLHGQVMFQHALWTALWV